MINDTCSLCKKDYSYKKSIHYCPHCGYNVGEYIEVPNIIMFIYRILYFITIIATILLFPFFLLYLILRWLDLSNNYGEFNIYILILFISFLFSKLLKYCAFKISKKNIKK